jgi:hypothetical protein
MSNAHFRSRLDCSNSCNISSHIAVCIFTVRVRRMTERTDSCCGESEASGGENRQFLWWERGEWRRELTVLVVRGGRESKPIVLVRVRRKRQWTNTSRGERWKSELIVLIVRVRRKQEWVDSSRSDNKVRDSLCVEQRTQFTSQHNLVSESTRMLTPPAVNGSDHAYQILLCLLLNSKLFTLSVFAS